MIQGSVLFYGIGGKAMDMDDICVVDRQSWICLVEEPCVVCVKDTPPYFLNFDTEGLYRLIYRTMYQNYWWT